MLVPCNPSHRDLTECNQPVEQGQRGGLRAEGSLGLRAATEFPVQVLQRVRRSQSFPQRFRKAIKGQKIRPRLFEAPGNARAERRPLRQERLVSLHRQVVVGSVDDLGKVPLQLE